MKSSFKLSYKKKKTRAEVQNDGLTVWLTASPLGGLKGASTFVEGGFKGQTVQDLEGRLEGGLKG